MAGRKPALNWTTSLGQYTTTIAGTFHRLGTDKGEAERLFRWLLNKADLGEPVEANPTFADVADAWLDHVRAEHDPERLRLCKARIEEFVRFVGEGLRVRDLRARHVEQWLRTKTGVTTKGTERNYKSIVLAALNWAASRRVRMIAANPIKGMLDLPEGEARGGEAVWSPAAFRAVLEHGNPAFADVVRVLAWTGARPSTVCKVEARHYLPRLRLWDVEGLYRGRRHRNKYVRRVWLRPEAVKLVERLNATHPTGPVFRNSHGDPWTPATLGVYLYQLRHKFKESRKVRWPDGLCLYGLRHTFATNFIKEHPDKLEYLRELLGHTNMDMIRRHYGHLFDEHGAIHDVLAKMTRM